MIKKKNNITKLIFLSFILILNIKVNAQNKIKNTATYINSDGLEINYIKNIIQDDNGMLWISGNTSQLKNNNFVNKKIILQRFNGYTFKTFKFDVNTSSDSNEIIKIIKKSNGNFLIVVKAYFDGIYLFELNPYSLKLKNIKLPKHTKKVNFLQLFSLDKNYLFLKEKNQLFLYTINENNDFTLIFNRKVISKVTSISKFIPLKDHCIISDYFSGTYLLDWQGKLIKEISNFPKNEHKKFGNVNSNLIDNLFTLNNKVYYIFRGDKSKIFIYNPTEKKFHLIKKNNLNKNEVIINHINISNNNFYFTYSKNKLQIFNDIDDNVGNKSIIPIANKPTYLYSDNLQDNIWVAEVGKLTQYTFYKSEIKKYLENYSIRSIVKTKENEYIIGTELNGLFKVNLKYNTVEPFIIYANKNVFLPNQIRGLFLENNFIWSNYDVGLMRINLKTHKAKLFKVTEPIECIFNTKKNIYVALNQKSILKFDKTTFTSTEIINTNSQWILDIEKIDNELFFTSNEGFFRYNEKTKQKRFYKNKLKDSYCLSLTNHPNYKLLIGTKSGFLYAFNPLNEEFKLLYADKLQAGIASVLFLENSKHVLWINTFNGIVKLNTFTHKIERFGIKNGLTNNEMNRYSAYKTHDNHFFVGSVKGLNYFNPSNLVKQKKLHALRFLAINTNNKKEILPNVLNEIKKIILPAENRFLNLEFGLNDLSIYKNDIDYKYRLGENNNWQLLKNQNYIQFQNLAPDTYNLEIVAINSLAEIISEPLTLKIISKNYFYKTWWFALLGVFLILAIATYLLLQAQKSKLLEKQFAQNLMIQQDQQLKRIAKDLHDGLGQNLLLVKNSLDFKNTKTATLVDNTIEEVRSISRKLHPFQLEKFGLTKALENMVTELSDTTSIFFSEEIEHIDKLFSKEKELYIYRIIQECFNNIIKHANAKAAIITIKKYSNNINIIIQDNGKGFNFNKSIENQDTLGLKSLTERVEFIKGKIQFESTIHKGTTVNIEIPYDSKS